MNRMPRNAARLAGHGRRELREDALAIAAAGLAAVEPAAALRRLIRVEGEELIVRGAPWVGLRPPAGLRGAGDDASGRPTGPRREAVIPLTGRRVFLVGAG
jgi:hypothetical protein